MVGFIPSVICLGNKKKERAEGWERGKVMRWVAEVRVFLHEIWKGFKEETGNQLAVHSQFCSVTRSPSMITGNKKKNFIVTVLLILCSLVYLFVLSLPKGRNPVQNSLSKNGCYCLAWLGKILE